MNRTGTRTGRAVLAAAGIALVIGALTACSSTAPVTSSTPAASVSSTSVPVGVTETPAPVETTPVVAAVAAPVADANSQVVNGVLYQGTAAAPVRIGTDTPGAAPAAEAGFPSPLSDFAVFKAAAIAVDATKYTVAIAPKHALDDPAAEKAPIGYVWRVFRVNQYGSWKAVTTDDVPEVFSTRKAATEAPKTLDGRTLDRAEYVLVNY